MGKVKNETDHTIYWIIDTWRCHGALEAGNTSPYDVGCCDNITISAHNSRPPQDSPHVNTLATSTFFFSNILVLKKDDKNIHYWEGFESD